MRKRIISTYICVAVLTIMCGCGDTQVPDSSDKLPTQAETDYANDVETGLEIFSDTSYGDIDGNGIEERMIIRESTEEGFYAHVAFYFNGKRIYEHDDILLCSPDDYKSSGYVDLDNDGKKEVFFSFCPQVNSMPLEEYAVVKKVGDEWKTLEIIEGEDSLDNGFPISITYHDNCLLEIKCEGYDKSVMYDARKHYENQKMVDEINADYYQRILDGKEYKDGDVCGTVAAWGVWDVYVDEYNDQPCIIANHGINGDYGKYDMYGTVDVYFNYDSNGEVNILDMVFTEYE